jgi:hypothetical protein
MQANQKPALVTLPFATNGIKNPIPEASQAGIVPGAASLNDGFPPNTMQPKTQGGIPPDGRDFNGILFLISAVARWTQAGGAFVYDPAFASNPNLGGYPKGAVLLRADLSGCWFNTVDNNTTNPDAADGSARGWVALNADWNAASGPGVILNRPALATVATSGNYADLAGKPAIQPPLGFTPVQQGGGVYQGANKVYVGWRPNGSGLGVTVDQTDEGNVVFEAELQANVANLQNNINALGGSLQGSINTLNGQVSALQQTPPSGVLATFFGGISANGNSNVTLPPGGTWLFWGASSASGQDFSQNYGVVPQYQTGAAVIFGQSAGGASFSGIGLMIAMRIA